MNGLAFLTAAIIVWKAGAQLTRTLDAISQKTGLGEAFVGMLLLGGITSLPEIANVLAASIRGIPDLAINNLLGSAAINILLLALADAFVGRKAVTSVVAKPATMMMCALCMLVLAFVAAAVAVGDIAVLGVGLWSPAICGLSVAAFFLAATYGERAPWRLRGLDEEGGGEEAAPRRSLAALVLAAAISGAVIFVAGYALSQIGEALAEQTGLGAGFVGFLLIGFATSTPELSSITTALRIQRYEMAFGQVLGTNFVNLSLILLADVTYRQGAVINALGRFEIVSALLGLVLIGVFLVGLLEHRDRVVLRMGYDSLLVILLFLGGVGVLYTLR